MLALGLLLAYWTVRLLLALAGTSPPRTESIDVDGVTFAGAALLLAVLALATSN